MRLSFYSIQYEEKIDSNVIENVSKHEHTTENCSSMILRAIEDHDSS